MFRKEKTREPKNNMRAKLKRTVTSVLPVAKTREGNCSNCGACCILPNKCVFLKFRDNGESFCKVNKFKSLNCRKYPRTPKEFLTSDVCGYKFR